MPLFSNDFGYASSLGSTGGDVAGGSVFSKVYHALDDNLVQPAEHLVGGIVNTLHDDAKGVVNYVGSEIDHVINTYDHVLETGIGTAGSVANNLIHTAGDTASNIGESLSFPLVVVGGALALFMLTKK